MHPIYALLALVLVCEALIKRPHPGFIAVPPTKHTKVDKDFVSEFREWEIGKTKSKIPKDLVAPFLGHGGRYEAVKPIASKSQTIESDHAPHKSLLQYLNLDKVDLNHVPENIKNAVQKRKVLEGKISPGYFMNKKKKKNLQKNIKDLKTELKEPIAINAWPDKGLQAQFNSNKKKISQLQRQLDADKKRLANNPSDTSLDLRIAQNKEKMNELRKKKAELQQLGEEPLRRGKKAKLAEIEMEFGKVDKLVNDFESTDSRFKALKKHNTNIEKAMGVLSIPFDKHRIFPSTGNAGLDDTIKALKNADAASAKVTMVKYDEAWTSNMREGISRGHLKNADDFAIKTADGKFILNGKREKTYDYQKVWEANFDNVVLWAHGDKHVEMPTSKKRKPTPAQVKSEYMKRTQNSYAKKFITTTIYYIKTPEKGYARLMDLYLKEYKIYLKNDFDSYKLGMQKLLEANKDFGWLKTEDIEKLGKDYKLHDIDTHAGIAGAKRANQWNVVEELIKMKTEKSKNPVIPDKASSTGSFLAGGVCSSSTRIKRSAPGSSCIFFSKRQDHNIESGHEKKPNVEDLDNIQKVKDVDVDLGIESKKEKKVNMGVFDLDGLPNSKVNLPSDADTISIDSKRLSAYLSQVDDADFSSVRVKELVVEHALRNSDKLTGSPEDVAKAKALLKQENLDGLSKQVDLARNTLRNEGDTTPKALTKYQTVKVSATRFANKVAKFTSASGKFSNSYGKIMLGKGVVTAFRHGDYESLALIGGRIGLDIALSEVTKMGKYIAKKATTKVMTKFGSQFLGKMAGPVGAIADIGMSVYSITKSVKILNNPNATRFDQNDAIANIVADSIDIVVTAAAAVLSLVFPPLAPLFAAVAFVINLFTTIFTAFYKASNHVDRINSQLPLLDSEKTTEYWRYVGGRDTSGYIQELIDTKKANNIVVNMTVQFLMDNPDYIGKVFPSRTMLDPEADCKLEEKACQKTLHFIPTGCSGWRPVSNCEGPGKYCEGKYKDYKCEAKCETGIVVAVAGHEEIEYRCKCGPDPPPFGYEVLDSTADFTTKRYVYLQRNAQDFKLPSGFNNYICKPSSMNDEGIRVSERYTVYEYLCQGAMGVKRSDSKGKFMLYDLGNGTDSIYLRENEMVDNLFVVHDGHKNFFGNGGDDTFVFVGPCNSLTGIFEGRGYKEQGNSLVLEENCIRGDVIRVNLRQDRVYLTNERIKSCNLLNFLLNPLLLLVENSSHPVCEVVIRNIHRVFGRKNDTEVITAICTTKLVVGGGGNSSWHPDRIVLPTCRNNEELNLTVSVEGHTLLDASNFTDGKVFTLLEPQISFHAIVPRKFYGTLLFKFNQSSSLINAFVVNNANRIDLEFSNGGRATFEFHDKQINIINLLFLVIFPDHMSMQKPKVDACKAEKNGDNQISILLSENTNVSRQLTYDLDMKVVQCAHRLEKESNLAGSIYGYDFIDNIFHLKSGTWNAFGGKLNNHFILISSEFRGSIDGGGGQRNTLQISDEVKEDILINLRYGFLLGRTIISLSNIQNFNGRPGFRDAVITSCNTKSLDIGGTAHDYVKISSLSCAVHLTIAVRGKVTVVDRKLNGSTTIQAGYYKVGPCSKTRPIGLELSLSNFGGGQMSLLLNYEVRTLLSATTTEIKVDGGNLIRMNGTFPSSIYFEEDYDMKSVLIRDEDEFIAFHELNKIGDEPKTRKGSSIIANVFKLANGTNWKVFGGNLEDTFSLVSTVFHGEIFGGQGRNSLYLSDEIVGTVSITSNTLRIQGNKTISFQDIHEFHGRAGHSESITVDCATQHVGMKGGNSANIDTITIPKLECDHQNKVAVVGVGYTELLSLTEKGNFDIYVQSDNSSNLKFKSDIIVTNKTSFNFAIQIPAYKLNSYDLKIEEDRDSKMGQAHLTLKLMDNGNFVQLKQRFEALNQTVNMMFVDEEFNSDGNILINTNTKELNILHALQDDSKSTDTQTRRGSTGAKNVFRLYSGNWITYGGTLDDSFILNSDNFTGKLHGLGGVNSLVLTETINSEETVINLKQKIMTFDQSPSVSVNSIQIVGGRKMKQDNVICACDTRLVMLEGGASQDAPDVIEYREQFCHPQVSFVVHEFTNVLNKAATPGNFTYHIRTNRNFDISYKATPVTNHAFKFEIPLEEIIKIALEPNETVLQIHFKEDMKVFPVNFQNLPTFHFGQGPDLVGELILDENEALQTSIIARSPFSGSIFGINGAENGIIVQTSDSLQSVIGGDKDDNIFLSQVKSVLLIKGGLGTNRLQLSDELHEGRQLKIDLDKEKITFMDTGASFVTVMKEVTLFTGREHEFERVVLGCDTHNVRYADEIIIRANCGYNTRLEIGPSSRVIFKIGDDDENELEIKEEEEEAEEEEEEVTTQAEELYEIDTTEETLPEIEYDEDDFDFDLESLIQLEPSTFYYHFSSIRSFDIEIDSFSQLSQTRHIFYLSFGLSELKSLRFAINESRLIYSIFEQNEVHYSHLVGEVDDTAMFYSQPEFMTAEGFLLRISRYGEIIAVVANPQEHLTLDAIQNDIIPRLAEYSFRLDISFMLETGTEFIYCGSPNEINLLTNRETVQSHLLGYNATTYEILDLDHDVFIYPLFVQEDSVHVLDLSDIISQIRKRTDHKYIPRVKQSGNNLEISMTNWTDIYVGKVVLVNGTSLTKNIVILLNSIAMEILPVDSLNGTGNLSERSVDMESWIIKPRPISIPDGHVYLLSAEDLEDGVEITKQTKNENASFEYSKDENDLIITSVNKENIESGRMTTFTIFDYYSPSLIMDSNASKLFLNNKTISFGQVGSVNGIQVNLGTELVKITSNEPLFSESGKVSVGFYEDILDREEYEIMKDHPDLPRKFKVPWITKIMRTNEYLWAAWVLILICMGVLFYVIFVFWRKQKTGTFKVSENECKVHDELELMRLQDLNEEIIPDYKEPKLIINIQLKLEGGGLLGGK